MERLETVQSYRGYEIIYDNETNLYHAEGMMADLTNRKRTLKEIKLYIDFLVSFLFIESRSED